MFESGIVKFTFFAPDGTNTWRAGTALDYHYWTQPIPNGLSWYIDQLPHWVDILCLWLMYFAEIVLPFLFFAPRNLRHFALFGQVLLQVAILLSGNYGFFNLLALALCLPAMAQAWPSVRAAHARLLTPGIYWNADSGKSKGICAGLLNYF